MAVLPMKRVCICALAKNRKAILEVLQRRGVVELTDKHEEDNIFKKTDITAFKATFEKNISIGTQALDILNKYAPAKTSMLSSLSGREELSVERYEAFSAEHDEIMRVAYRLTSLSKDIQEANANIPKLESQIEALKPWLLLDIPLGFKGTKKSAAFIGTLVGEITQQQIMDNFSRLTPSPDHINVDIISSSKEQTCILVLCPICDSQNVEEALRTIGFAKPAMLSTVTPSRRKQELEQEIAALQAEIAADEAEIISYRGVCNALKFTIDYYIMRSEKYDVIGKLAQSRRVFVLSGFIPERECDTLEKLLSDKYDIAIEFDEPNEDDETPVLLDNNAFAAPVESVVESYSMPGKGERDPTNVMACFYYLLFGMMLSDAAYGIIMIIACGLCLWKFKNMESGMKKTLTMFLYCGISTTFWGFMFGSFFGDAIGVVAKTFFNSDIALKPLWFEPVKEPMRMLVFAFLLGIIHLFAGLAMKLAQCIKDKKYLDALYDAGFWYMLVGGGIIYLLTVPMFTEMLGVSFILPPVLGTIATVMACVGAVGIIFTSGRDSRNWFKRLLKGLYGLYNVTGYLSDILSYSRLLALGLATGVIATVINQMGSMGGGGIGGAIMFILVFLVGHTINIGINLLGAYVHTNRLQFVEFFGKFYEGGGRKFMPFTENTKYYKIREDI
ncbi:MAG: V-type ATP synthase subunit I [Hydrogenoanaerobacterium sp.]